MSTNDSLQRALEQFKEERKNGDFDEKYERYAARVKLLENVSHEEWMTPEFQKSLWMDDSIERTFRSPLIKLNLEYLCNDKTITEKIWQIKLKDYPNDDWERAQAIDKDFNEIRSNIINKINEIPNNKRRFPISQLVRIFISLRPNEMSLAHHHLAMLISKVEDRPEKGWISRAGQSAWIHSGLKKILNHNDYKDAPVGLWQNIFCFYWSSIIIKKYWEDKQKEKSASNEQQKCLTDFMKHDETQEVMILALQSRLAKDKPVHFDVFKSFDRFKSLKPKTVEGHLFTLCILGFLEKNNEEKNYTITDLGSQFSKSEEPQSIIIKLLIDRVFGYALLLQILGKEEAGLSKEKLNQYLTQCDPKWIINNYPAATCHRSKILGLIEEIKSENGSKHYILTEQGEYWANQIPEEFNVIPDLEPEPAAEKPALNSPTFLQVKSAMESDPEGKTLIYRKNLFAEVHAALHVGDCKRFVLLAGLSGTGKTALARAYAQAYCTALGLEAKKQVKVIAVRPDWTDPTGLLGYLNPLSEVPRYEVTPTLQLLLDANERPDLPFFLCLDEMNLARVEHYFAPFLSAMETGKALNIHGSNEDIGGISGSIDWPKNLFIFGTVNMDESTHPFSDKVLDRAFTFELWEVDLDRWWDNFDENDPRQNALDVGFPILTQFYEKLEPIRRHFGYRTCNEFISFLHVLEESGVPAKAAGLDAAILTKVLPKLRGDDAGGLKDALIALVKICKEHKLTRSQRKIEQLQESLESIGIARFWS